MTTFGPEQLFGCPHCQSELRRPVNTSGNTFGSRLWSDGFLDAPMLYPPLLATSCPMCLKAFFLEDTDNRGVYDRLDSSNMDTPTDEPPLVEHAGVKELTELLESETREGYILWLLIELWHGHNHVHRRGLSIEVPQQIPELRICLERLVNILPKDGGQRQLMLAEALRELGRFPEAITALDGVSQDLDWVTDSIRVEVLKQNAGLVMLNRPKDQQTGAIVIG